MTIFSCDNGWIDRDSFCRMTNMRDNRELTLGRPEPLEYLDNWAFDQFFVYFRELTSNEYLEIPVNFSQVLQRSSDSVGRFKKHDGLLAQRDVLEPFFSVF